MHAWPAGHAAPQRPQCAWLDDVSAQVPSQTVVAPVHVVPQTPSEQNAPEGQAFPHVPQCLFDVSSSTSQPLVVSPSQSAKPFRQVYPQRPIAQRGVAWGGVGHSIPHAPQCARLVAVCVSQPLAAMPSQSPAPGSHPLTVQRPVAHAVVARGAAQLLPQAPQLRALVCVSTHAPSQQP